MQTVVVFQRIVNEVSLMKNVLTVLWNNVVVKCPTNNHNLNIDLKLSPTNHPHVITIVVAKFLRTSGRETIFILCR